MDGGLERIDLFDGREQALDGAFVTGSEDLC
jgi:hypothetical protein